MRTCARGDRAAHTPEPARARAHARPLTKAAARAVTWRGLRDRTGLHPPDRLGVGNLLKALGGTGHGGDPSQPPPAAMPASAVKS